MRHILPLLIATALAACTDAAFARGTGKACDNCLWDDDCAEGFFCDQTQGAFVCRTRKMAEALADAPNTPQCDRDCLQECASSGYCHAVLLDGTHYGCQPKSAADCEQSLQCAKGGHCLYCYDAKSDRASCRAVCP